MLSSLPIELKETTPFNKMKQLNGNRINNNHSNIDFGNSQKIHQKNFPSKTLFKPKFKKISRKNSLNFATFEEEFNLKKKNLYNKNLTTLDKIHKSGKNQVFGPYQQSKGPSKPEFQICDLNQKFKQEIEIERVITPELVFPSRSFTAQFNGIDLEEKINSSAKTVNIDLQNYSRVDIQTRDFSSDANLSNESSNYESESDNSKSGKFSNFSNSENSSENSRNSNSSDSSCTYGRQNESFLSDSFSGVSMEEFDCRDGLEEIKKSKKPGFGDYYKLRMAQYEQLERKRGGNQEF